MVSLVIHKTTYFSEFTTSLLAMCIPAIFRSRHHQEYCIHMLYSFRFTKRRKTISKDGCLGTWNERWLFCMAL